MEIGFSAGRYFCSLKNMFFSDSGIASYIIEAAALTGVDDLYIGVECGLNDVLEDLNKGYSADETKEQCLRLNAAGIRHCDLLMLGTAGKGRGLECARASAALENEIRPNKILINTMSAFVGTLLDEEIIMETQPHMAKNIEICYVWLVENLATVPYNNHINQISGGFYGYCRGTGSGEKICFI